jgi:hypothetical protein
MWNLILTVIIVWSWIPYHIVVRLTSDKIILENNAPGISNEEISRRLKEKRER